MNDSACYTKMDLLLCCFFGHLGAHRFYRKKSLSGLLMLLTLGGLGLWYLKDLGTILYHVVKKNK